MENDVSKTIDELKRHLGAETDADLARKLRVERNTVSSWKSRGSIPDRYLGILRGESHQFVATPPLKWGDYERSAFSLALFRFTRLVAPQSATWAYREYSDLFVRRHADNIVWILMSQAQQDIAAEMNKYPGGLSSPETAVAMLIRDAIDAGDAAIEEDRKSITAVIQGDIVPHFLRDL